jgi:hypothetical protein
LTINSGVEESIANNDDDNLEGNIFHPMDATGTRTVANTTTPTFSNSPFANIMLDLQIGSTITSAKLDVIIQSFAGSSTPFIDSIHTLVNLIR